jgi:hypothetical protein
MQKPSLMEMRGEEGCFPGINGFLYRILVY